MPTHSEGISTIFTSSIKQTTVRLASTPRPSFLEHIIHLLMEHIYPKASVQRKALTLRVNMAFQMKFAKGKAGYLVVLFE